jgi:cytochrome c
MNKLIVIGLSTIALSSPSSAQHGDVALGQRGFRMCAPCHSLEPDRNMTGPSLAGLW